MVPPLGAMTMAKHLPLHTKSTSFLSKSKVSQTLLPAHSSGLRVAAPHHQHFQSLLLHCQAVASNSAPATSGSLTVQAAKPIPTDAESKEPSTLARHDYGKIRGTLGIPDFADQKTPTLPSSLTELVELLFRPNSNPFDLGTASQIAYSAGRTGFFVGASLSVFFRNSEYHEELREVLKVADHPTLLRGLAEIQLRDTENVSKGYYRAPYDMDLRHRQWNPMFVLSSVGELHEFLRGIVDTRNNPQGIRAVLNEPEVVNNPGRYPDYYLQNFHHQTGGWLSEHSAKNYDMGVQGFFLGSLDALARQGLVPLHFFMKGRSQQETTLLEVACGAGRLLTFYKDNYPRLNTIGVDLSPTFLEQARANLDYFDGFKKSTGGGQECTPTTLLQGPAHDIPLPPESVDVVSCSNLFHELPPEVRKIAAADMFRILKPGGIVIMQDAVQECDNASMFWHARKFPTRYHEPYMETYFTTDFPKLFGEQGFQLESSSYVFVGKMMCFRKP